MTKNTFQQNITNFRLNRLTLYSTMLKHSTHIAVLFFTVSNLFAQEPQLLRAFIFENDTIPICNLNQVTIVSKRIFKNERAEVKWNKLRRDVTKVYPYAKASGRILRDIDAELALIQDKKQRRKFLDKKEDELMAQFEGQIRDLTITQGKILIKLIDRETQHTCYHLVKEFRGGFSAFFWQGIARIFGSSLKYEYDNEENRDIEIIVRSLEENDQQNSGLTLQK